MELGRALLITTLEGLSTGLGGLLAVLVKPGERLLAGSMDFAAGMMLAVSLADLCPEALRFCLQSFSPMGAVLAWGLLHDALNAAFLNGMTVTVAGIMTWVGAAQLLPGGWAFGRAGCTSFGFGVGTAFMLLGIAALH